MGTKMDPNYACQSLHWLCWEEDARRLQGKQASTLQTLYRWSIWDIFWHTTRSRGLYRIFSAYHPSLKYTFEISESSVSFLDLYLSITDARITKTIHYKPTDTHSYLDYSSSHPPHCKKTIPYSQFLRLQRICSDDDEYVAKSKEMASFLENRGSCPRSVVTNSQRRTQGISRERARKKGVNHGLCELNKNENYYCVWCQI